MCGLHAATLLMLILDLYSPSGCGKSCQTLGVAEAACVVARLKWPHVRRPMRDWADEVYFSIRANDLQVYQEASLPSVFSKFAQFAPDLPALACGRLTYIYN